eukprot:3707569-Prymnesium_polylepis.1
MGGDDRGAARRGRQVVRGALPPAPAQHGDQRHADRADGVAQGRAARLARRVLLVRAHVGRHHRPDPRRVQGEPPTGFTPPPTAATPQPIPSHSFRAMSPPSAHHSQNPPSGGLHVLMPDLFPWLTPHKSHAIPLLLPSAGVAQVRCLRQGQQGVS